MCGAYSVDFGMYTYSPTLQTVEGAVLGSLLNDNFTDLRKTDVRVNTLSRLCIFDNGCHGTLLPFWKPSATVNEPCRVGQGFTYFKGIKWMWTRPKCAVAFVSVENEINLRVVCDLVGNSVQKHRRVLFIVADLAVAPLA